MKPTVAQIRALRALQESRSWRDGKRTVGGSRWRMFQRMVAAGLVTGPPYALTAAGSAIVAQAIARDRAVDAGAIAPDQFETVGEYMAAIGRKGGQVRGASKARGGRRFYSDLAKKGNAARWGRKA